MNAMTNTARLPFDREDQNPGPEPTLEERLADMASDYETLDAESVAGVGI